MPSKSKAQFGKMGVLFKQGKIGKKVLDDFNKGVHPNKLPEHSASERHNPLKGTRRPRHS